MFAGKALLLFEHFKMLFQSKFKRKLETDVNPILGIGLDKKYTDVFKVRTYLNVKYI